MSAIGGQEKVVTVSRLLEQRVEEDSGKLAYEVAETPLSRGELNERALEFAVGLERLGVERGDRMALMAPTSADLVVALFAAVRGGVITVPTSIYLKGDSLAHQLRDSGSKVVVTDGDGLQLLKAVHTDLPDLRAAIVTDSDAEVPQIPGLVVKRFADVVDTAGPLNDNAHPEPEDLFAIIYTSGTTGLPKGCMISHGYAAYWGETLRDFVEGTKDDVFFTAAPLFHIGGICPMFGALTSGGPMIVERSFSASRYLKRVKETGANIAIGVGFIAQSLLKQPPDPIDHEHTLEKMSTVALSPQERKQFEERFGIPALTQQYGQTECWPASYSPFSTNDLEHHCGEPSPGLVIEMHDEKGDPVLEGEVGEIVVRPQCRFRMFDGYWQDADKTVEAFRGLWYHTGDLGRLVDGRITYVDRKKDSMRRGGENVSAFEIEQIALLNDSVAEVAVFGVPDPEKEEDIVAVVVPENDHLTADELHDYFISRLPYYAVPRYIALEATLPRNASGRVQKNELRRTFSELAVVDFERDGVIVEKSRRRAA